MRVSLPGMFDYSIIATRVIPDQHDYSTIPQTLTFQLFQLSSCNSTARKAAEIGNTHPVPYPTPFNGAFCIPLPHESLLSVLDTNLC